MRITARLILKILRIHGRTRWSNEFIQSIDPSVTVEVPEFSSISNDPTIWFRTGHGRLFWRATESPSLDLDTNRWITTFNKNDVFYDVGANIGLYSIMAAKFLCTTVYAVEIDLMNTRMLYENIYMNSCQDKITVLPFGLDSSSHQEKLFLKTMSYGDALHNLRQPSDMVINPSGIEICVPVFRLDDVIEILRLPSPTKLKIDVDGVDFDVLKGSANALKTVTSLVIEYMPSSDARDEIHNFLSDHGLTFDFDSIGEHSWGTVDGFFSRKS
ncbi:MAG: FkbM family methyltransferase [Actinobacteria bacterium]|nr:FkbM family methyltransferase [Actinomycetota bacterium]